MRYCSICASSEYYFGGGIQCTPRGVFSVQNGIDIVQTIPLGETHKTKYELEQYLRSISRQFCAATYDLINNNVRLSQSSFFMNLTFHCDSATTFLTPVKFQWTPPGRKVENSLFLTVSKFLLSGLGIPHHIVNLPSIVFSTVSPLSS